MKVRERKGSQEMLLKLFSCHNSTKKSVGLDNCSLCCQMKNLAEDNCEGGYMLFVSGCVRERVDKMLQ